MFSFVWFFWLNFRNSVTLCDTCVLGGREGSAVLTTGATSPRLGGRKLGTFRDIEEGVIGSDDSDILWVDDAAEGALDSMEQL